MSVELSSVELPSEETSPVIAENAATGFRQLNLQESLLTALDRAGYTEPTPIQARTIPLLLEGRDVLGQAQTGTGKTAAFALPLLQRLDLTDRRVQVLVLAPTRELAMQVASAFERYASGLERVRVAAVYGGQDYLVQFRQLDQGAQIVVGTPGRVMDHMRRGSLKLDGLRCLVLDEADEMLRMGFAEDVDWISTQAPTTRQTALFSATMPGPIRQIAQRHLTQPAQVTIEQRAATADTVRQRFVIAAPHQKQAALHRVLQSEPVEGVLVFVKTKLASAPLAQFLSDKGYRTAALNGDVAQKQREKIVADLRSGRLDVVVATDVAARGLDVQRVSHVINYDLPRDSEAYVHRIGRTGRAGRSGQAILFVHPRERRMLDRLEQATRQRIEAMEIPNNRAINKLRVTRFHEQIAAALAHPQIEKYAAVLEHFRRDNGATAEQTAAALAVMLHADSPLLLTEEIRQPSFVDDRSGRAAVRPRQETRIDTSKPEARPVARRRPPRGFESFRIEVGHTHQASAANIARVISEESGLEKGMVGRIDIFDDHSMVDLPTGMPREIFRSLKQVYIAGQRLNISRLEEFGGKGGRAPRFDKDRLARKPAAKAEPTAV